MSKVSYKKRMEFMMMKSSHHHLKEICRIMEQTRSSYVPTRSLLMDVRRNRADVSQFYRAVKKAHRLAVEEEKIVSMFDLVRGNANGSYTNAHRELKNECSSAIIAGEYRTARRLLKDLSHMTSSRDFRNEDIRLLVTRGDEWATVMIGINNNADSPIIVKGISTSSESSDVRIVGRCSFSIPVNGQRVIKIVARDPTEIDLCIDYDLRNRPYRYFASVGYH